MKPLLKNMIAQVFSRAIRFVADLKLGEEFLSGLN
jgi:hypothetical protein